MTRKLLMLLLGLCLLLSPVLVLAQSEEDECELAYLFNAWARSSPEGVPNGAVFGFLVNLSGREDTLLGVSTDVAETVELHETTIGDNDVMQMHPVEGGFVVDANSYLELKPAGFHIMLVNLREMLEAGSTLSLVLNFENAGEVQVLVPIREMTAMDGQLADEMGMEATPEAEPAIDWDTACADMHIVDPWVRPASAGMPNSAAYALLLNLTDVDDVLIGASTPIAQAAELHEVVMGANDVMQMQPVEGGIEIPAGEAVLLAPGGYHLMLIGLISELEPDDNVDVTLTFAERGELQFAIPVREPEDDTMGGSM